MNKVEYLKLVKKIGKAVRSKGYRYARIYSNPVVENGYTTKIYKVTKGGNNGIARLINKLYGDKVIADWYETDSMWNHAYNVRINPIEKVTNN